MCYTKRLASEKWSNIMRFQMKKELDAMKDDVARKEALQTFQGHVHCQLEKIQPKIDDHLEQEDSNVSIMSLFLPKRKHLSLFE